MSKLIEIEDLLVQFKRKSAKLTHFRPEYFSAVDHVSFSIEKGETFGLVGESGSGKSTIGRAVLGYLPPAGGRILYEGKDITRLNEKERLPYQRKMQSVFQDPYSSLDPSMNVRQIIEEPMDIHQLIGKINLVCAGGEASAPQGVTFVGDGIPIYEKTIWDEIKVPCKMAPASLNRQRGASIAAYGELLYKEKRFINADDFAPEYLRKSQAERVKDEKKQLEETEK